MKMQGIFGLASLASACLFVYALVLQSRSPYSVVSVAPPPFKPKAEPPTHAVLCTVYATASIAAAPREFHDAHGSNMRQEPTMFNVPACPPVLCPQRYTGEFKAVSHSAQLQSLFLLQAASLALSSAGLLRGRPPKGAARGGTCLHPHAACRPHMHTREHFENARVCMCVQLQTSRAESRMRSRLHAMNLTAGPFEA